MPTPFQPPAPPSATTAMRPDHSPERRPGAATARTDRIPHGPMAPSPAPTPRAAPCRNPLASLVIARGPGAGTRYPIGTRTVLGRHQDCDIAFSDSTVSWSHARIEYREDHFLLADEGSLNGTYLNRVPLTASARLADGDVIQVGRTRLIFHSDVS